MLIFCVEVEVEIIYIYTNLANFLLHLCVVFLKNVNFRDGGGALSIFHLKRGQISLGTYEHVLISEQVS